MHKSNTTTVVGIILATLAGRRATFFWKDQTRTIGGWVGNHAAVRQALARVQTAARLLLETLAAEFNDCLFPQAWEIFDLRSWEGASVAGRQRLMDKFSTICRHRCWNQARTEREFAIVRDTALNKFISFPEHARDHDGAPTESGDVSAPGSAPQPLGVSASGAPSGARGLNRRCWAESILAAQAAHGELPAFRMPLLLSCVCVSLCVYVCVCASHVRASMSLSAAPRSTHACA